MTKTNAKVYLYCPRMGWHRGFNRRIWVDGSGDKYIKMRGWTKLDWAISTADWHQVEREY